MSAGHLLLIGAGAVFALVIAAPILFYVLDARERRNSVGAMRVRPLKGPAAFIKRAGHNPPPPDRKPVPPTNPPPLRQMP